MGNISQLRLCSLTSHRITPPEVLDPKALIPPSNFNFRKPGGASSASDGKRTASTSGSAPLPTPGQRPHSSPPETSPPAKSSPLRRPVSITPELSTPAEVDEESILKSEYVVIRDTRHVEFNQRVDGEALDLANEQCLIDLLYRTQCRSIEE